ncbi:MAG TPA: hypothetical protein DF383_09490 [Deltaproteobacteria bacterium]|nr:hypothetical protein [Deltaproteobacteria bacterium]
MKPPLFYFDTSIFISMILGERAAREALALSRGKAVCSSVLLLIEAERNLVRMSREGVLGMRDYDLAMTMLQKESGQFQLCDLTPDLCLTGQFPVVRLPRTSDLVHLRTALWFHQKSPLQGFMTLDVSQGMAAREMGLPVPIQQIL